MEFKSIAKPYVKAILAVSSVDELDSWKKLLFVVRDFAINKHLQNLLNAPHITEQKKVDLLLGLLSSVYQKQLDKKQMNFLKIIIKNKRINAINAMYNLLLDSLSAGKSIDILSAYDLNDEALSSLKRKLSQSDKKSHIDVLVSKDIMGGVIVKMGDGVLDYSIQAKLEQLAGVLSVN